MGPGAAGNGEIGRYRHSAAGAVLHIGGLAKQLGKDVAEALADRQDLRSELRSN